MTTLFASSASASASYYTQYLVDSPGEEPGRWFGDEAGRVGLCGTVAAALLEAVLSGYHPVDGTPLGAGFADRVRLDGSMVRAVAGFDATFSAPKSVSVLWALTGDRRVLEAHDIAVNAALAHVERFGSTTRVRRDGGRMHLDTGGVIGAVFRQSTSRAGDPQLHTHAVISAKVRTGDGRWRALDARYLKRRQRMLGGIYQSVLRAEMVHRFGVEWRPVVNGQAELAAVPDELVGLFSKRARQVETALGVKVEEFTGRQGRSPNLWERAALTREAAADSRARKTTGDLDPHTRWRGEAEREGHDLTPVASLLNRRPRALARGAALDGKAVIEALSVKGSTWARADVVQAVCDSAPALPVSGERWAAELERMSNEVMERCVNLDPTADGQRRESDGRSVWIEPTASQVTSPQILAEEERLISWALDTTLDTAGPVTKPATPAIDRAGLDVLQAEAAAAVAGDARLVIVVGPAGTGKTTMLRAAHTEMRNQLRDRVVFGVTPSAKAARVLESETGIISDTVAKLLHEWTRADRPPEARYQLPAGATVIVDEAGMLSTPAMAKLVDLAEQEAWRLVLVGDPAQLQAVGRGGMFAELCRTVPVFPLATIHRFTNRWEADASVQLRNGDPTAIDTYLAHSRIHPGKLEEQVVAITRTWLDHTAAGRSCAVTVSSNEHARLVNHAIQTARRLDASVQAVAADGQVYVGDVIATRRNDRQLRTDRGEPVRNRDVWTITAISSAGDIEACHQRGAGTVRLPADYVAAHVQLGYAVTEHGNQGATTDHAVALASPATSRRGLYVAATRGRASNHLHVITDVAEVGAAVQVLRGVIAGDRVDRPAVTVRRDLVEMSCVETPATLDRAGLQARVRAATDALRAIDDRIADLHGGLDAARWQLRRAEREHATSGLLGRRGRRRAVEAATTGFVHAQAAVADAVTARRSLEEERDAARAVLHGTSATVEPGAVDERLGVLRGPVPVFDAPQRATRDVGIELGL